MYLILDVPLTYSIYMSEQKNIHQGASADVPAHAAAIGACEQSMQWQQVRHVQDASCSLFFAKIIPASSKHLYY